jgi:hypothetical protein
MALIRRKVCDRSGMEAVAPTARQRQRIAELERDYKTSARLSVHPSDSTLWSVG